MIVFHEQIENNRFLLTVDQLILLIIKELQQKLIQMQAEQQYLYSKALPIDEEGYTKSFDLNNFDREQATNFYKHYGIIIFNDVLNEEEIEKTIDDLWADIQARCGMGLDRTDPTTWKFQQWKGQFGFVNSQPLRGQQLCQNRNNPNVYKSFKMMYELTSGKPLNQRLLAMFDRGSAMRPSGRNPQWISRPLYHFDINPWWWTEVVKTSRKDWRSPNDYKPDKYIKWLSEGNKVPFNGYTKLAGVLALSDTNQISGGFECVCGFQNYIKKWCLENQYNLEIANHPTLDNNYQKIYQRKGSLLIFTRELPHNIYQNLSKNWRFAQYLRMSPQSSFMLTQFQKEKRKECVKAFIPSNLSQTDEIGREIYMIDK